MKNIPEIVDRLAIIGGCIAGLSYVAYHILLFMGAGSW